MFSLYVSFIVSWLPARLFVLGLSLLPTPHISVFSLCTARWIGRSGLASFLDLHPDQLSHPFCKITYFPCSQILFKSLFPLLLKPIFLPHCLPFTCFHTLLRCVKYQMSRKTTIKCRWGAFPTTSSYSSHGVGPLQNGLCWWLKQPEIQFHCTKSSRTKDWGKEKSLHTGKLSFYFCVKCCCSSSQCNLWATLGYQIHSREGSGFPAYLLKSDPICPFLSRYLEVLVKHTHVWLLVITVHVLHLPSQCYRRVTAYWWGWGRLFLL